MQIMRSGCGVHLEVTLTNEELRQVYEEQQHIYDVDDIDYELDGNHEYYDEKYNISDNPVTEVEIEEMANILRELLNKDADAIWSVCKEDAVKRVLERRVKKDDAI